MGLLCLKTLSSCSHSQCFRCKLSFWSTLFPRRSFYYLALKFNSIAPTSCSDCEEFTTVYPIIVVEMTIQKAFNYKVDLLKKRKKSKKESIYWPLSNELKRLVIKQTTIQQLGDAWCSTCIGNQGSQLWWFWHSKIAHRMIQLFRTQNCQSRKAFLRVGNTDIDLNNVLDASFVELLSPKSLRKRTDGRLR